ncbi:MAG: WYL domain-containing protein, partial [Firmicutes bacterium]|nr:WYL domain-containing protein [Bacillota bacterium]
LIRKLESLCSREEAKQLASQVVVYDRPKTINETIYYNVDMLHSSIYRNRQITFQYVEWTVRKEMEYRHGGAFYVVSPLHLVWDDENYYLIAYDEKAGKVKHYRVDKMRGMAILEEKRSEAAAAQQVDLASFGKKTFGMFGGRDVKVRLLCKNHLAGVMLDRFGSEIWMVPKDEERFSASVVVTVSRQFFGWVTAIGEDMQIEGPAEVREEYREYLRRIQEQYKA